MGVRADDRIWCTAAAGWSKSLRNVWLAAELTGAETVIHEGRFDAAERLRLLAALRPQVLCMSPTEYRMCAAADGFGSQPLPGLREAVAAGEALDAATVARWQEAYGVTVRDGYGQTETGALAGAPAGGPAPPGAIGPALPGVELEIRRGGELWVRAATVPTFFRGYWQDAEATRARLRDGWWQTGDLAREEDGLLWFAGRVDDVISSAGYRIGPGEVEEALRSHPAVRECAVVGIPDPERGQIVHADVIAAPGTATGDALADELRRHVRTVTAPYKYPRSIRFVDALPRTTTGKIRRSAVREDLAGRHGSVTESADEIWGPGP
jgi:acyl-coenzyme A synthetase/AMP-(fatty) acid ligase